MRALIITSSPTHSNLTASPLNTLPCPKSSHNSSLAFLTPTTPSPHTLLNYTPSRPPVSPDLRLPVTFI
ncbi:hypothetical protein E2C01_091541 [Portunus trituberculatus]|uniref:Uncharacterized protein n=1 Tax=Portunus trituberculatus TaxID=210409 RepID=A0A5B7JHS5_PORTR|nr:hypothetical protein [Portunus trituberculatus]